MPKPVSPTEKRQQGWVNPPPPRKKAFVKKEKGAALYIPEGDIQRGMFDPCFPEPGQGTKEAGRPDFDLTHPDQWPKWLQNCHTENAAVHVKKDGHVVWVGGSFHDGIWCGENGKDLFMGGRWRDGIWLGGDFYEGVWSCGEFRDGIFHSWIWKDGVFRGGVFRGLWLGGIWETGVFQGFWKRTSDPPGLRIEVEVWE